MIEIGGPHRVRMQLDAAEVDDPRQSRGVIHDHFFGGAAGGKRERYGAQPRRPGVGRALLVKGLAFGAVHKPLQHDRPIADAA